MGYDIFSTIVLDIQIWVSFDPILEWRQNEELGMGHKITVLKTGLKNELITPKKHSHWIWSFYHSWNIVYKFGPFLAQFWLYDVTRIVKFPNVGKMTKDQIFLLKKYTWFEVWNFLLLLGCDILLWNCFEEFGKVILIMGTCFTPSSKYFTKILKF